MCVCVRVCVCVCLCLSLSAYLSLSFSLSLSATRTLERRCEVLHLLQELQAVLEDEIDAAVAAKVLCRLQELFAAPKPKQVALLNVEVDELLKDLVQRLVRVRHNQGALIRVVVVQVGDCLSAKQEKTNRE